MFNLSKKERVAENATFRYACDYAPPKHSEPLKNMSAVMLHFHICEYRMT